MKKIIFAATLAAVALMSGCVSQEKYNSVVAENVGISNARSALERENNSLKSENERLQEENSSLKSENDSLKSNLNNPTGNETTENQNDIFKYSEFMKNGADTYINPDTGNKWYHGESNIFVSYIEENDYSTKTDDEMVVYLYSDMLHCVVEYPSSLVPLYTFGISDKDGNYITMGFLTMREDGIVARTTWYGEYERLNRNPEQLEYFGESE